jgi:hypothetical protein
VRRRQCRRFSFPLRLGPASSGAFLLLSVRYRTDTMSAERYACDGGDGERETRSSRTEMAIPTCGLDSHSRLNKFKSFTGRSRPFCRRLQLRPSERAAEDVAVAIVDLVATGVFDFDQLTAATLAVARQWPSSVARGSADGDQAA